MTSWNKRGLNLTEFAGRVGHQLNHQKSSPSSVVTRDASDDDKTVVARLDSDQHCTYFRVREPPEQ